MKNTFLGFFKKSFESLNSFEKENSLILFGLPYERVKANKRGSRKAPKALRKKSLEFSAVSTTFNIFQSKTNYYDIGDFNPIREEKKLQEIWTLTTEKDFKLLVLGGDHSITYDTLSKAPWDERTAVIWFDAHADLADEYPPGIFQSHGTVFANLKDKHKLDKNQMLFIGGHAYTQTTGEHKKIQESNEVVHIPTQEVLSNRDNTLKAIRDFVSEFDRLYISIDADAFDQAYVPTLATMEPFGLSPQTVVEILEIILPKTVYVDLVEFRSTIFNKTALNFGVGLLFKILEIWEK
jgi:agmatinase